MQALCMQRTQRRARKVVSVKSYAMHATQGPKLDLQDKYNMF